MNQILNDSAVFLITKLSLCKKANNTQNPWDERPNHNFFSLAA